MAELDKKKPSLFGKDFPVRGIYEPSPIIVGAPVAKGIAQIWRWSGRPGFEGLVHWSAIGAGGAAQPLPGPVPGVTVNVFGAPANTVKGSITSSTPVSTAALSQQEQGSLANPLPLSQTAGSLLTVPLNLTRPYALVRNVFVPRNMMVIVVLTIDPALAPDAKVWGYLFGTTWRVGTLSASQLTAQQLTESSA
jgi:hypothetical protein